MYNLCYAEITADRVGNNKKEEGTMTAPKGGGKKKGGGKARVAKK